MNDQIKLYYKNILSDVLGEHGLGIDEIKSYSETIAGIVESINDSNLPYRKLPYDRAMVERTNDIAEDLRDRYDNLVVLGIGGSALGNIALQTALNDPFYNLLPADKRKGPRLFVIDNVDPVLKLVFTLYKSLLAA